MERSLYDIGTASLLRSHVATTTIASSQGLVFYLAVTEACSLPELAFQDCVQYPLSTFTVGTYDSDSDSGRFLRFRAEFRDRNTFRLRFAGLI